MDRWVLPEPSATVEARMDFGAKPTTAIFHSWSTITALMHQQREPAFAETTLRPAPGGGYELRCPPEHEAQLFEYYFGWSMQAPEVLESIDIPVKVIGADPTAPFSFLPSMDLSTLNVVAYDFVPDTTHLLQLEAPERCAALTVEFLEEQGLA